MTDQQTVLYIAGPMTGYADFNYSAFNTAAEHLRRAGHAVLNPADTEAENPTPGDPQSWEWYMRRALRMVLAADGLALLPGWPASRGAAFEVHVATTLKMPLAPVEEWLTAAARRRDA